MWPALIGGGAALLGGFLGSKGERPMIDPRMLERLFGPQATANEAQALYKLLANSPAFSQMMNASAIQGSQVANRTASSLASRGLSTTPYAGFLKSAGRGYGAQMQRQGQQNLFLQALQAAMQSIAQRQNLYGQSFLQKQQTPSWNQMLGSSLLSGGAQGLLGFGK